MHVLIIISKLEKSMQAIRVLFYFVHNYHHEKKIKQVTL